MKIKPILSSEVPLDKVRFPIYVSTKYDGIRCIVKDAVVYSRSLKPIRNKHVQKLFGKPEYEGFDGELIVGDVYDKDVFQKTTSGVMSEDGEPNVTFHVFDLWNKPDLDYRQRQRELIDILLDEDFEDDNVFYVNIHLCYTKEDLMSLLEQERKLGGEGLIGRTPNGLYKYGRSTPKEQYSVKFKFFEDAEFEIIGFNERMHNTNELKRDELGYAERSSAKSGLVPMNTLGSLILKYNDTQFCCGVGFDDKLRQEIWDNKEKYLGKLAKVKYMSVGMDKAPRLPVYLGIRDVEDL